MTSVADLEHSEKVVQLGALTIDTSLDPDVSVLVADSTVTGEEVARVGLMTS